jgi:hypothetical protein
MRCNRHLCRIVVCAVVFCSIRATALADPILLTFDDVAPGVYVSGLYADFGVRLSSRSREPDEKFGFFGVSQIGIIESDSAVSAPNILTPRPPTVFNTFTDIAATFLGPGTTPLFTDFLSMAIVSTAQSPWVIRLVGMDGYLDEIQGSGSQVVSITRPRIDLKGFEFRGSGAEGLDNLAIGDLSPVPEPGTLALLGVGLAGLLRSVRNRRRS